MGQAAFRLVTLPDLVGDFRALGVTEGQVLMVHSSLRSLGYVLGGAATVIRALVAALGDRGTLVMPAFSPEVSDPARWSNPALPAGWIERARAQVPAYDADTTPTSMGAIPEAFRRWPGVRRGPHPQVSVCARGPRAGEIVAPHALAWGEGAGSPSERLAAMDAGLLLLGVGFNRAALLHYAESLVPHGRRKVRRIPIGDGADRSWVEVPDVGDDLDTHFPPLGAAVLTEGPALVGKVGGAETVLASARDLTAFASQYLARALDRPA